MTSNIIKVRASGSPALSSSIKKEVHQASLDAAQILAEARAQATQLVKDAQGQSESILAEATKTGYRAGSDQWSENLAEAWRLREQFLSRNETQLVKLAVAIAGKIVGREVQADPSLVLQTTREALKAVRREKKLTILVSPAEEAALREHVASLRMLLDSTCDLVVMANPSVAPGGCIVESEVGIVDARIDTQLASLERALLRRSNDDSR
jgi:type III secretion protein L